MRPMEHIATYAQQKRLSQPTLARWLAWPESRFRRHYGNSCKSYNSREIISAIFLDWCEEIVLRDGGTAADLLSRPELRQPLAAKLGRKR